MNVQVNICHAFRLFQYDTVNEVDYHDLTPEEVKKQMTESEWQKVYDMSQDKNLYHNLCQSLFPTIHGEHNHISDE